MMTSLSNDHIIPLSDNGPVKTAPAPWTTKRLGLDRRELLRGAVGLGTAAGMAVLGVFPMARKAYAEGYDILGSCPSYADSHNCSPGCGPSQVCGLVSAGACCQTNSGLPHWQFHKDADPIYLLRPNECYGGNYDGWIWKYSAARGAACPHSITYRCHDGWTRVTQTTYAKSICRWTTACT